MTDAEINITGGSIDASSITAYTLDPYKSVSKLQDELHSTASSKGFWDDAPEDPSSPEWSHYLGNKLMLVVSELVEAHDDLRSGDREAMDHTKDENGKPVGFPSEIADAVIRLLDLSGEMKSVYGWDLGDVMRDKAEYNKTRPYKHGKAF